MKKISAVLFSVVLCVVMSVNVSAYTFDSDPLYSVELPEDFHRASDSSFLGENGETFVVNYSDNTEEKLCVADLNETEIKEYADKIATESKKAFESLGVDGSMSVVSAEKIKHPNGKTAFVAVFKTVLKEDDKQTVRYQKLYEFTGESNKFSFSYTAKQKQINDFDGVFDTIVINEPQIESVTDKLTTAALFGGVILLVLVGIVRFIRTPVKKK